MLVVAAGQLRDPVALIVLMKSCDRLLQVEENGGVKPTLQRARVNGANGITRRNGGTEISFSEIEISVAPFLLVNPFPP